MIPEEGYNFVYVETIWTVLAQSRQGNEYKNILTNYNYQITAKCCGGLCDNYFLDYWVGRSEAG